MPKEFFKKRFTKENFNDTTKKYFKKFFGSFHNFVNCRTIQYINITKISDGDDKEFAFTLNSHRFIQRHDFPEYVQGVLRTFSDSYILSV